VSVVLTYGFPKALVYAASNQKHRPASHPVLRAATEQSGRLSERVPTIGGGAVTPPPDTAQEDLYRR
jgi:hypothetical protein